MSITDQIEEERRKRVAIAIREELTGYTDDYENELEPNREKYDRMAAVAINASGLPLRSAQVAAVLAECAEMHSSARLLDALGVEPDKAKALRTHADLIRRAIEEAER